MNDENTGEQIGIPDWKVHGTAHCEKNPHRGYVCTTCWIFGHSAAICKMQATYGKDGNNNAYREWWKMRRRDYWVKPTTEAFKKESAAQIERGIVAPDPHPCMAT